MQECRTEILRVLVGSRAHGLNDKDYDYDYRAIYIDKTSNMFKLGYKYKGSSWCEGKEDNTAYELGHFLQLATRSNPAILEVFMAPIVSATEEGEALLKLFNHVWDPQQAFLAFTGYSYNQRKKMLEEKDERPDKYAVAYMRTLYMLIQLLRDGNFDLKIPEGDLRKELLRYRYGDYTQGEIIDKSAILIETAKKDLKSCKHENNINKVNEFLLNMRKKHW